MSERRLSNSSVAELPASVAIPGYGRDQVLPGIVHLGAGAFHRAHQAVFVDDCLNHGDLRWGIIAASLRSSETKRALEPQDNLYTLAIRGGKSDSLRVIGAILRIIVARDEPGELLAALTNPDLRLVTLTVTEKGYCANLANGRLLRDHPDVIHDLANPASPRTALGYLTLALKRRREAGLAPITLLSCDNLPSNGKTLHTVLVEFAANIDEELAQYIAREVRCPSCMVDRIVPATTGKDKAEISSALGGVADAWPVVAEPFFRWVIEDNFASDRPYWEASQVQFVPDVAPFEKMKLRLLNGAHTAIAAIGQVAGLETVSETVAHPAVQKFLRNFWMEVLPTLSDSIDANGYAENLLQRFSNPALNHRTAQIASDSSQKVPQRLLEPLAELVDRKMARKALVFAIAAWIRSCADKDETGAILLRNDPAFSAWSGKPSADAGDEEIVLAFLDFSIVFGAHWRSNKGLVSELTLALGCIRKNGIVQALELAFEFE